MAIGIIQQFQGVGRSIDYYPLEPGKAEDGTVNIALGLGKYVVEWRIVAYGFALNTQKMFFKHLHLKLSLKREHKSISLR